MFSVCLCSWNDLEFLKILYRGLKKNTKLPYELIVHDNGSEDGTSDWLSENNIRHTIGNKNEGVAAVNYAVKLAKYPYIVDINADMYVLPGWDIEIYKQIQRFRKQRIEKFMISSCLVEPLGDNPEYTIFYAGHTSETFDEDKLVNQYLSSCKDWERHDTIQYSHPVTMPKSLWEEMGGVDTKYEFGVGTDHDIPASAYKAGCRDFVMLGKSRVYHFISQTIRKLPKNRADGQDRFKDKWNMTVGEFRERMGIAQEYRRVNNGIV